MPERVRDNSAKRPFGPLQTSVPVVGQGTWQMERDDRAGAIEALRRGIDAGLAHLDTAEMYGSGAVEEIVGEAIVGRRDEVFLASKVLPSHASFKGTLRACEQSLARLRVQRLDLYLLHWPGSHPLEQTIAAFEKLVEQGKIAAWGLSNFDTDGLEEALAIAGSGRIACNQVLYHLNERAIEHEVLPWCERNETAVVGYSPFGSGRSPSRRTGGGDVLAAIAAKHGVTPHAIALAFLARRPSLFTIPKAASVVHVLANAAAASIRLSHDETARIDRAFPLGLPRRGVPTL
jgi:diketogulonate reductase-like aldo/keto reductase